MAFATSLSSNTPSLTGPTSTLAPITPVISDQASEKWKSAPSSSQLASEMGKPVSASVGGIDPRLSSAYVVSTMPASTPIFTPSPTLSSFPSSTSITQPASSLWQDMSTSAQACLIVALCILTISLSIITLFLLDRCKHRHMSPFTTPENYHPNTTIGARGILWPEKVILRGDAKEFHALTRQYERDPPLRTSLREGGKYLSLDQTETPRGFWVV
ncbi:uncharacterized protein RAG0_06559 [Rhynchosporium agropyri]|uniref:Uncharacterized protein n=1 Tax=Rhynchosporium agropyri TaxID=914238 RepID=A0A1E1KHN6_9HELO|nr:uncharacterized protein RAG0_06559 [Rhynchosporium agropyri]